LVDRLDRGLDPATAQMPARALGDHEMKQHRRNKNHEPTRQGHQPKRVRIVGEQEADQKYRGK